MKRLIPVILMLILISPPVYADDFQDGQDAHKRMDYKTAFGKWKPLAEQGNAEAQYQLGRMYSRGRGAAEDYKEALKWYKKSAEQGYVEAQYKVGRMANNDGEKLKWSRLAAEQGHSS